MLNIYFKSTRLLTKQAFRKNLTQCKKLVFTKVHCYRILSTTSSNLSDKDQTNNEANTESLQTKTDGTIAKVVKEYIQNQRNFNEKFTENNTVTAVRAMQEYFLKPEHLKELKLKQIRNPYSGVKTPIYVYKEQDVIKKSIEVLGSKKALEREQAKLKRIHEQEKHRLNDIYIVDEFFPKPKIEKPPSLFSSGAGKVVIVAITTNASLFVVKSACWLHSGSASMFSEAVHSLADTINQLLLLWGIHESKKSADKDHPYGFGNMRYITSLISGVGIFCLGSGASVYHGVLGLLATPVQANGLANIYSIAVLGTAALLESASLWVAYGETKRNAYIKGMTVWTYIKSSHDPSTNVVLLEDACAVLGIGIASAALLLTHYLNNPIYDCIGSVCVGGLLAVIASFLVSSNVNILLGKSIPDQKMYALKESLEDDAVIRGVYDIKATQVGMGEFKFKAEIDFDGCEITQAYLNTRNMQSLLEDIQLVKNEGDLEQFMLSHGEQIIDTLGMQVDRIENELKNLNPELKHIDLEIL